MGYIYKWKPVSDGGMRRWRGPHPGLVVERVFKLSIPFYDLSDSEWKKFIGEKMYEAQKKGMVEKVEGIYDIRMKAFGRPLWKGKISDNWRFD
jgi:hypothetical protein